ncbi:unannotated protein [freshwater metagenome]|uniref:Unannotated protein n=1 Tax=freshwater metagenome TaxID=449393 RepID=A0A6J6F9V3_9ZZZZ
MELRLESPFSIVTKRSGSSPPSPVFDFAPRRFIAIARVSCTSCDTDPYDIAPVEKRLTISEIGSTSSIDIAGRSPSLKAKSPRKVIKDLLCSSTLLV